MKQNLTQLYLITPPEINDIGAFAVRLDATLSAAPVACVQLRLKNVPDAAIIEAAKILRPIIHNNGALLVINDNPQIALDVEADGVHIGQDDMDYFSSRELLGEDAIIGVTCHNSRDLAFEAALAGANYVAFGAFFETPTKKPKSRADVEILKWWNDVVEIPSVAIGGITPANASNIIKAGADFLAVSSGVWDYPKGPSEAVKALDRLCAQHS